MGRFNSLNAITKPEGVNATKQRGRPKLEKRGGRREGGVKYPLRTATKRYLEMREDRVKESTLDNESRILWHIVSVLEDMLAEGELSTNNPWKMSKKEVKAILDRFKYGDRPLENETMEKYIRYLEGVLDYCGNHVIGEMRKESPHLFPRRGRKPIAHLTEEEVNALQEAARSIDGWNGAVLRFITAMYPATGLRPSELRKAWLEDMNPQRMTFKVRHPKGEASYGERRIVSIMPMAEQSVHTFLAERQEYIRSMGLKSSKYLIPNLSMGKDEIYSSNHFRKLKKVVQEATGIEFRLKDYRSTFASLTVQKDPSLMPEVSQQLGHSSLVTTQRFYADMSLIDAGSKLRKAWSTEKNGVIVPQTRSPEPPTEEAKDSRNSFKALIGSKEYLAGYG